MTASANDNASLDKGRSEFENAVVACIRELQANATKLTRSPVEADDLVQETTLRAWTAWEQFSLGTNARAWLHRIMVNTFINGYRRKRRERVWLDAEGSATEIDAHVAPEPAEEGMTDEVTLALESLPEEFRIVLLRIDIEDRSYRDVALEIGCPIGTVMSRLHRARRAMRHALRSYAAQHGYAESYAA